MKYKVNGGAYVTSTANTECWPLVITASANCVPEIAELRLATQSADGSNGPALVQIIRCDADGGSAGSALTPAAEHPYHTAAARFTALRNRTLGGGATNPVVIEERLVPVQGEVEFALVPQFGKKWQAKAGGVLIISVTTPQAQQLRVGADVLD